MRLFAAVLPPDGAVRDLESALGPLRALPDADLLRWTGPETWHFTLAFLGEVGEELLPELGERLGRAARRGGPFPLRIAGGGHFGGRALWAGARGDLPALRRLAERVRAAAGRAGAPPAEQHHAYRPHLTLARVRGPHAVDLRPYAAALAPLDGPAWQAAELCLVRSHLPDGRTPGAGPRYEALARWPLGPGR
ncbi:RNA 2',3'-cyclic phosphodiesterase [Streptomyces sp. NPDC047002]|uniref:RNA 2',3'-cyclic phosphodiesterase n=1 Tax=Streptomyces sp. NPDC047002 TaxID=3155475 RepID=UPI003454E60E